jgi:GT2 family glycosyltransferase
MSIRPSSARPYAFPAEGGRGLSRKPDPASVESIPIPLARPAPSPEGPRLERSGKFLFLGQKKFYIRGVTYGTFAPAGNGETYGNDEVLHRDFGRMSEAGINAIRVYTVPPPRLLDVAACHGLRVMIGIPWEEHVTFLDDPGRARSIEARVRAAVHEHLGHPAVLAYVVGNEIPASIVRWHGARRVERFLHDLYRAAKEVDPDTLVSYANYPSTEYLRLSFLDFACFNVYLEERRQLADYITRLHHVCSDMPLVIGEIGLDSRRHGTMYQAECIDWQVRTSFADGCAGVVLFSWTDEWHRGGHEVMDWDFGVTDRQRQPKLALSAVARAFAEAPFPALEWPRISVVVCSFNGAKTARDCFAGLASLEYPSYEVIVVDDGSEDDTAAIASEYGLRVIRTENEGLSNARNVGLSVATGDIVAYIDDDAHPDPHWLMYLAWSFMSTENVGVGGPNLTPLEDGPVAACVANAPGGPIHVLISDREAEHIPGCNMAFRADALRAVGGFDRRFRVAGDDVDLCWRLQERGWTLGFSPAAVVWHHRRSSIRDYWKQQRGYGEAEALLERKWPERYNRGGHSKWSGRLYGNGHGWGWRRGRIYQGVWGSAAYQSVYRPAPGMWWWLPAMPEWYLFILFLAGTSALGTLWPPLLATLPLLGLALAFPVAQAVLGAVRARFAGASPASRRDMLRLRSLTAFLHLIQPLARLRGRLGAGLTPWRRRGALRLSPPIPKRLAVWSERWQGPTEWVASLEEALRADGAVVIRGGEHDRWDLEPRYGNLGAARLRAAVEEHGNGRQLLRVKAWPFWARPVSLAALALIALGEWAFVSGQGLVGVFLTGIGTLLAVSSTIECGAALAAVQRTVSRLEGADLSR